MALLATAGISAQDSSYGEESYIQLALLLDTSNSMDGLINQVKSQLWKIVSQTARERRNGKRPILQVALYEYGNDSLSILNGYVREVVPFTTDLDRISQALFELTTNGGSEFCGKVISTAVKDLAWDGRDDTLRLLFIAGNEPFDQGPTNYNRAIEGAVRKDITVNTIFCGDYDEGRYTHWEAGAHMGGGIYVNINSDFAYSHIPAPQDRRIEELNRKLNHTYLGYGYEGEAKMARQEAQDANAQSLGIGSLMERAQVKSSSSYSNSEWDLVDAYAEDEEILADMAPAELPPALQGMDEEEQEAYIKELREERRLIQEEIAQLGAERELYIAEQRALTEEGEVSALDKAVIEGIRKSAEAKGFHLE
ncbi:MAG: VWA domain-containing protein [Spirochaetales bacterium]|nr:VWA domain-containing protein [Spirochaetales bacterium]